MIILRSRMLPSLQVDDPVCALNAVWVGSMTETMTLPNLGHLFLLFPLEQTRLSVDGVVINHDQYLWITQPSLTPIKLHCLSLDVFNPELLVLMLSSGFIAEMADFLDIPADFNTLLHRIPLAQGDMISSLLQELAEAIHQTEATQDLFFEVVGQILQLLRIRHQALQSLAHHKRNTISDLLPRLLEARQFIESHHLNPIKTHDVANHVALSEYHFARLFKTAFETTVHQYVMRLRLDEARRLLESSDASVTNIALDVGYNSLSAFNHAFRRTCGITPSAYITQFRDSRN